MAFASRGLVTGSRAIIPAKQFAGVHIRPIDLKFSGGVKMMLLRIHSAVKSRAVRSARNIEILKARQINNPAHAVAVALRNGVHRRVSVQSIEVRQCLGPSKLMVRS